MIASSIQEKPKTKNDVWLDRPVFNFWPNFSIEKLIIIVIICLTLFSRVYDLGARVMAHDEVNHVVPSFDFYEGRGYSYDPVTHGPLQFHLIAASYFLFGDSDFSSRLPHALFGIAVVLFALFAWRRYLGRVGAIIAGIFFMISPYMLFYSRYARNEIFIVFWGSVMLWTFLRYLEGGDKKFLYLLTVITALHYADKATSYIFTAESLIFMALLFIASMLKLKWKSDYYKLIFIILVAIVIIATAGVFALSADSPGNADITATGATADVAASSPTNPLMIVALMVAVAALISALAILVIGSGFPAIRGQRSFDLIILQLSLVLPLLSAAVIRIIGFDPLDYTNPGMLRSAFVIIPMALLSVLVGLLWNKKVWIKCAIIFWSIFLVFYTTFFTRGDSFFVGLLGALGYWMSQQAVQRGTQPLYYYALVQIPIYEFLPAIGTIIALIIGINKRLFISKPGDPFSAPEEQLTEESQINNSEPIVNEINEESQLSIFDTNMAAEIEQPEPRKKFHLFTDPPDTSGKLLPIPTLTLLLFWSLISLIAFSLAGERMPWLTTHIALPLILSAAFATGYMIESTPWQDYSKTKTLLSVLLGILFMVALSSMFGSLFGNNPPFKGKELTQLSATSTFLLSSLAALASAIGMILLIKGWKFAQLARMLLLSLIVVLTGITIRASFRASFINYDYAKEFLVYAHASGDPKDILAQVEQISARIYGDKNIPVAYDNDSLYPYWWYFRDYPNRKWYADAPTKELRESPVILAGYDNYAKIEPVVGDEYYMFTYKRMWWPIEDYDNLTWQRLMSNLKDPQMRAALWQIWFNRDYSEYGTLKGNNSLTLATWSPASDLRMYVRKDIAAQIWEYGITPSVQEPEINPYEQGTISLAADLTLSSFDGLTLSNPKAIAFSPDGSLYVSDTGNHRILHITTDGELLHQWGSFADVLNGNAPASTFNQPSGIAVSKAGFVYVADTWNHRIQKFTASGQFITMWDIFNVDNTFDGFWGPRGVAVDKDGNVYVTDTGKQRVVIFDGNGEYITQFGGVGVTPGFFDEPVGIAVDNDGMVYLADAWNQRIQVMKPLTPLSNYTPYLYWDIKAWKGQSLENKPFLALDTQNQIFITDPDLGRILQFDPNGNFIQLWGGYDNATLVGIASGIAIDGQNNVWITDSLNNSLLKFNVPKK